MLQIVIEKMKKGGSVVNITSLNSELGFQNPGYVGSKSLKMYKISIDYAKYNIRINNIGPGYIKIND